MLLIVLTLRLSPIFLQVYPRSMRVRVCLDFDILIESFISLCIIETVGAIFREYKPWIVLLITQLFCIFCKMGKKSDLSPECQKFVKKLFAFFSKEIVSFDRVYQRTSKALGVSYNFTGKIPDVRMALL
jgi:hypothetical protein